MPITLLASTAMRVTTHSATCMHGDRSTRFMLHACLCVCVVCVQGFRAAQRQQLALIGIMPSSDSQCKWKKWMLFVVNYLAAHFFPPSGKIITMLSVHGKCRGTLGSLWIMRGERRSSNTDVNLVPIIALQMIVPKNMHYMPLHFQTLGFGLIDYISNSIPDYIPDLSYILTRC